jgi:hypothetical protein
MMDRKLAGGLGKAWRWWYQRPTWVLATTALLGFGLIALSLWQDGLT